ncbi:hypothetical protein SEA_FRANKENWEENIE_47 [Streptomyces phage Frankenweenie]|nr:hypothetical protein SEA_FRANKENWEENIE_47 [Streptomyces phage Frankenweenie]
MKIHEVLDGDGKENPVVCCGMLPLLLPSGDLVTEHPEIVTCDNRAPRCPECKGEAGYIGMRTEPPVLAMDDAAVIMKVDPCAHEFRVRVGIQDSKIRLEKRGT